MNWTEQVNAYCERLGPGLWGEPVNALTNAAFVIAAIYVFQRTPGDVPSRVLAVCICLIGICSGLFHTLATKWAGLADSLSILLFIMIYLYHSIQRVLGRDKAVSLLGIFLFLPYAVLLERGLTQIFGALNGSVSYLPVLILIVIFGALAKEPETRRGFWLGSIILMLSLTFRSVDQSMCGAWPYGTHFMWHILNAIMLGWMVLVLYRIRPIKAAS